MKYCTDWWGVELTAETEEEEMLLRRLVALLPDKAERDYDDGDYTINDEPENEFVRYKGLTLTFHR